MRSLLIPEPRSVVNGSISLQKEDQTSKDPSRSIVEDMNVDSVEKPLLEIYRQVTSHKTKSIMKEMEPFF